MFIGNIWKFFRSILKETKIKIKAYRGLCSVMLTYVIVLSAVTISKHRTFLTSFYDLGIFNQAFWTTLFEHKLFYETGDLSFNPGGSFFGTHFSPILFLLLPFYAIYPSCETLLVLQTIVLAVGAMPIYWMAREKLGDRPALFISILYFVYPPLITLNLNDFHLETFTSTFLLLATYYLEHGKWTKFLLFAFLAMATLEFVPLILLFMVIYGALLQLRKKSTGQRRVLRNLGFTALTAILWFVLALKSKEFFNPHTSPIPSPWHQVLSEPNSILQILIKDLSSKIFYVISFLAPLAFIPLLAPEPLIMAIPWFGASFVSNNPLYYSIYYHYDGFVIPFVFIALIKGIKVLTLKGEDSKLMKRSFVMTLLATTLFGIYLLTAPGSPWMYQLPIPTERTQLLYNVMALIPPDASILTQNDIGPHLSSRSNVYVSIPTSLLNKISVDYVLIDMNSLWFKWRPVFPSEIISPKEFAVKALESGEYGILASAKGILLLKRGYRSDPIFFIPYIAEYDYRDLIVVNGRVIKDVSAISDMVLYHGVDDGSGIFWYGPYVNLAPGLYEVTFTLKTNTMSKPENHVITLDVTASAGKLVLAKKDIYGVHIPSKDQWFNITLIFGLNTIAENVEFRGFVYGSCSLFLDRIIVRQLSPLPTSLTELTICAKDLTIINAGISQISKSTFSLYEDVKSIKFYSMNAGEKIPISLFPIEVKPTGVYRE